MSHAKSFTRIVVYPKDIALITGRSERYGRRLLKQIKSKLNKNDYQIVTVDELAEYLGIPVDRVEEFMI